MELLPTTAALLQALTQPYADAMAPASEKDAILTWLLQILPNHKVEILPEDNADIVNGKILHHLKELILSNVPETVGVITPWDLVNHRKGPEDTITRLFGGNTPSLPVTVIVGPNTYTHYLTLELLAGLMLVLDNNDKEIKVLLFGEPPEAKLFGRFILKEDSKTLEYSAQLRGIPVTFETPEFVRGVSTACEWKNIKAHDFVKDLKKHMANEVVQELDF